MQCVQVQANGSVELLPDPVESCPGFVVLQPTDIAALSGSNVVVSPEEVTLVFTWGFGVVLFFWSLGYAIGAAKRVINLA